MVCVWGEWEEFREWKRSKWLFIELNKQHVLLE